MDHSTLVCFSWSLFREGRQGANWMLSRHACMLSPSFDNPVFEFFRLWVCEFVGWSVTHAVRWSVSLWVDFNNDLFVSYSDSVTDIVWQCEFNRTSVTSLTWSHCSVSRVSLWAYGLRVWNTETDVTGKFTNDFRHGLNRLTRLHQTARSPGPQSQQWSEQSEASHAGKKHPSLERHWVETWNRPPPRCVGCESWVKPTVVTVTLRLLLVSYVQEMFIVVSLFVPQNTTRQETTMSWFKTSSWVACTYSLLYG